MPDAEAILDRVRSYGANVVVDDGSLRVVGREKLPAGAMDFITANRDALIYALGGDADEDQEGDGGDDLPPGVVERFPAIDFGAGTPPEWLAFFAKILTAKRPVGILETDWQWFLTRCRQIVEEASWLKGAA